MFLSLALWLGVVVLVIVTVGRGGRNICERHNHLGFLCFLIGCVVTAAAACSFSRPRPTGMRVFGAVFAGGVVAGAVWFLLLLHWIGQCAN
jgi:hypothetical protein